MGTRVNFLYRLSAFTIHPLRRRLYIGGAIKGKSRKLLQQANQVKGGFIVCELSNADK